MMSSIEANKATARRWIDLISANNVDELIGMTAPTWTMQGGPPNLPAGAEGIRVLFQTIGPVEQTWTIDDIIAEGDKVVVRATNTCRQESFFGVPGNGRWQVFTATFILRIANGIVLQTWRNADDLGRIFQLGGQVVPALSAVR